MKTELEQIVAHNHSSLRILVNPNLSDFFFWHFHPEYELVFLDGADGTRHVGKHVSRFHGSDLVLIGSNIPHLNFDYGIKHAYQKIVVHIKPDFLTNAYASTPELKKIGELLTLAQHGIAFGKVTQECIGDRLKKLPALNYLEQFLELLALFQLLAFAEDRELLHLQPYVNPHTEKEQGRLKKIYAFLDENFHRKIEIDEIAGLSNLTNAAFCRYFKKMTRLTFTEFVNHYRIDKAKKLLRLDNNITETCFQCGFESISYFNKVFRKVTGENPLAFKKKMT
jgi:AraC-like DNA-binding protein